MSFPRYPKYRDSGVEWLGEVPEHWEVGSIRRFAQMKTGHTPSRNVPGYWENCTIPWFGLADVWQLRDGRQWYLGETAESISDLGLANSAAELLPAGTVVFSRTASVGFSGIMPRPMATTQDFWNWIPRGRLCSEYLLLLFRAMQAELQRLTMGSTHKTIYQADAAALRICVPSIAEQRRIVAFVATQTREIDSLVDEQQRLVGLLGEKKRAVILQAVTKGLKPDAPTKASGVQWLGDVPEHWLLKPLRLWATVVNGFPFDANLFDSETGYPLVRIRDLNKAATETNYTGSFVEQVAITADDVLIGMDGDFNVGRWRGEGTALLNQRMCCVRGADRSITHFLEYALPTPLRAINDVTYATTVKHLSSRDVARIMVALPENAAEREQIGLYLDKRIAELENLSSEAESGIALLQERRTALISAAVTGKIDVLSLVNAEAA